MSRDCLYDPEWPYTTHPEEVLSDIHWQQRLRWRDIRQQWLDQVPIVQPEDLWTLGRRSCHRDPTHPVSSYNVMIILRISEVMYISTQLSLPDTSREVRSIEQESVTRVYVHKFYLLILCVDQ